MGPSGFWLGQLCDGGAIERTGGGYKRRSGLGGAWQGAVLRGQQLHWWKLRNILKIMVLTGTFNSGHLFPLQKNLGN